MSDHTKLLTTRRRTKPHRLFDQLANVRGQMDAPSYSLVLTPEGAR